MNSSLWQHLQTFYEQWFQLLLLSGVLPAITMQQWRGCCITMMYTPLKALVCYCWTFVSDNAQYQLLGFTVQSVTLSYTVMYRKKNLFEIKIQSLKQYTQQTLGLECKTISKQQNPLGKWAKTLLLQPTSLYKYLAVKRSHVWLIN